MSVYSISAWTQWKQRQPIIWWPQFSLMSHSWRSGLVYSTRHKDGHLEVVEETGAHIYMSTYSRGHMDIWSSLLWGLLTLEAIWTVAKNSLESDQTHVTVAADVEGKKRVEISSSTRDVVTANKTTTWEELLYNKNICSYNCANLMSMFHCLCFCWSLFLCLLLLYSVHLFAGCGIYVFSFMKKNYF